MSCYNNIPYKELRNTVQSFGALASLTQLNVKYDQTPRHNIHHVDDFLAELGYYPKFANEQHFKPLNSAGYVYNPNKLITASDVSYEVFDSMASKNRALKSIKKNTFIMCPVCDPFEKLKDDKVVETMKKVTSGGTEYEKSSKSPTNTFYSTLSSSYVHHMAQCHGAFGDDLAQQPILGFVGPKMILSVICPHVDGFNQPCLQISPYNFKAGNGFKGYYRHVAECHHGNCIKPFLTYKKTDVFVPLYVDEVQQVTRGQASKWLRLQDSKEARSIIAQVAGFDPVLESQAPVRPAYPQQSHISIGAPVFEIEEVSSRSHLTQASSASCPSSPAPAPAPAPPLRASIPTPASTPELPKHELSSASTTHLPQALPSDIDPRFIFCRRHQFTCSPSSAYNVSAPIAYIPEPASYEQHPIAPLYEMVTLGSIEPIAPFRSESDINVINEIIDIRDCYDPYASIAYETADVGDFNAWEFKQLIGEVYDHPNKEAGYFLA